MRDVNFIPFRLILGKKLVGIGGDVVNPIVNLPCGVVCTTHSHNYGDSGGGSSLPPLPFSHEPVRRVAQADTPPENEVTTTHVTAVRSRAPRCRRSGAVGDALENAYGLCA